MSMDEMSAQRKGAHVKWRQAEHEMQRGHVDKAIDLARTALEEDPGFVELRMWLAHHFVRSEETRKAAHELEEIIHRDRDNEEAWGLLRRIDPASADRLQRLQNIAPDPFVAERAGGLTDDLESLDDLDDEEEYEEEAGGAAIGADPFVSAEPPSEEFVAMEEADAEEEPAQAQAQPALAVPDDRGGHEWEYEQDRLFLGKWEAEPVVAQMTATIQELWDDMDAWDSVLSLCAHADRSLHPQVFEATAEAARKLEVEMPELMVFPERCMHPVIIKDRDPMLAVPTGLLRAMSPEEMLFQIGREIGHVHTGYLAQMQVVKIITNRKAALIGDLASSLTDFLSDKLRGWDEKLSKEELTRLKRLGHAWQQRCELTADRAGLVCCEDSSVACTTIAKTTGRSIDEAATLTADRFLKQFEGQDVGELAKIPVEESPSRNPSYAAYRIHMLRWWATTPECMRLLTS